MPAKAKILKRLSTLLLALLLLLPMLPETASAETNINLPLTISTANLTSPSTLTTGETFALKGTVSCNYGTITKITAVIKNRSTKKTVMDVSSFPKKGTVNMRDTINRKVTFGKLSAGSYSLKITAYAKYGSKTASKVIISKNFTVKDSKPTISIANARYPSTLKKGSKASLRGVISCSQGKLTSVNAYITDQNGKHIMSAKYTPNKKTFDIEYTVNKAFKFSALPAGTYTYAVYAKAKYGSTVISKTLIQHTFTVE